ncbi:MAG TPA: zf-HC2 domain-containing protein [Pyrinomonadaceae bacterium]|nr:zf-HC2 domain-containing protein [Pyrinomonadaceae bacterium]
MNTKCYDIGIIQAFLDGELSSDVAAKVTNHIAACDACSLALADAEEESAVVFAALDREFNTLVPTQRLWNRINDSIAVEKRQTPFFGKVWTFLTANLGSPSFAIAASVLIIFGIFAAVWGLRTPQQISNVPAVPVGSPLVAIIPQPAVEPPSQYKQNGSKPALVISKTSDQVAEVRKDNRRGYQVVDVVQPVTSKGPVNNSGYLPGEESYVKTIASLSQSVSGQKDTLMRPSERVSYERDMAVVNDSIKRMRDEVSKNPKNESAKQVLYTSYQNKIDLLNSVAQKEELVASLK